jgi:peroxiredoxin
MQALKSSLPVMLLLLFSLSTQAGLKLGQDAPSFELKSLDGKQVSLQDLTAKGHVMLVFWELECVYCFMHVKEFNALHRRYQNKGLTLAAINFLGEHENAVQEYVDTHSLEYLILADQVKNIDVAEQYKVIGSPTIVVISPAGKVVYYGHKLPVVDTVIMSK